MKKNRYKRLLNALELIFVAFVILSIYEIQKPISSVPRYLSHHHLIRATADLLIISALGYRAFLLIKRINKPYRELRKIGVHEKVLFVGLTLMLLPDIRGWYMWYFYADLYGVLLLVFSLPLFFWTIDLIERAFPTEKRIKYYGILVLSIAVGVLAFSFYLDNLLIHPCLPT